MERSCEGPHAVRESQVRLVDFRTIGRGTSDPWRRRRPRRHTKHAVRVGRPGRALADAHGEDRKTGPVPDPLRCQTHTNCTNSPGQFEVVPLPLLSQFIVTLDHQLGRDNTYMTMLRYKLPMRPPGGPLDPIPTRKGVSTSVGAQDQKGNRLSTGLSLSLKPGPGQPWPSPRGSNSSCQRSWYLKGREIHGNLADRRGENRRGTHGGPGVV